MANVFWLIVWGLAGMMTWRNIQVSAFHQRLIKRVSQASKRAIERDDDLWETLWDAYEEGSYSKAVFRFWEPVERSWPDDSLLRLKGILPSGPRLAEVSRD